MICPFLSFSFFTFANMDALKRRHSNLQLPKSPPPKYIETFDAIPLSESLFDQPSLLEVEKDIGLYRQQERNKVHTDLFFFFFFFFLKSVH
jgi:hypothetical protein